MVRRVESDGASRGGPALCGQQRPGLREGAGGAQRGAGSPQREPTRQPSVSRPTEAEPTLAAGFSSLALRRPRPSRQGVRTSGARAGALRCASLHVFDRRAESPYTIVLRPRWSGSGAMVGLTRKSLALARAPRL